MSKGKFTGIGAKGYYIALILCAVAIGICGYMYYRNAQDTKDRLASPDVSVAGTVGEDVHVSVTRPTLSPDTNPTEPSAAQKSVRTAAPVAGEVVATYAMDALCYNPTTRDWRVHNGVDYAAEEGTKVCAAAAGTVYTVYEDDTMGMTVVIRHEEGYTTRYASLANAVAVKTGDTVELGQTIGCVGTTALLESAIGHHVHFSVSCNDKPMDPAKFLTLGDN